MKIMIKIYGDFEQMMIVETTMMIEHEDEDQDDDDDDRSKDYNYDVDCGKLIIEISTRANYCK